MANDFFAFRRLLCDPGKLERYKREVGYEEVISNLPANRTVLVDWPEALKEFSDAGGATWRTSHIRVGSLEYLGQLDVVLQSELGSVSLEIMAVPHGSPWGTTVDVALYKVSRLTNMYNLIYGAYKDCPGDFCLISAGFSKYGVARDMVLVYGNIFIEMRNHDYGSDRDIDLRHVARALQSAMERAVAANPEGRLPARPKITYTVSPTRIKVGESFTVTAIFGAGSQRDPETFDVESELVSNNIEYEKDLGKGVYKFTAKAPGPGTIAFSLLDKKTLWVFTDNVPVAIEPAR